jgi:hypothetical protein
MKTNKNLLKTVFATLILGLGSQLMAMENKREREESEEEVTVLQPGEAGSKKGKAISAVEDMSFNPQALEWMKWNNQQNPEMLILQSNDGQEFVLPVHTAQLSETIRNLIEDAGTDNPIPLPNVDGKTLAKIIQLLPDLEWLMAQSGRLPTPLANGVAYVMKNDNYVLPQDELLYIPRAFQPTVNNTLQDASIDEILDLLAAANYLDIPFIINAAAAVLADRILKITTILDDAKLPAYSETAMVRLAGISDELHRLIIQNTLTVPKDLWEHLIRNRTLRSEILRNIQIYANQNPNTDSAGKENAQVYLKGLNLNFITKIDKNLLQNYIIRHLTFRQCGITQEYSIADYIRAHGQPEFANYPTDDEYPLDLMGVDNLLDLGGDKPDLDDEKLTSLFGIQLLNRELTKQVLYLYLGNNCLFNLSTDPQGIKEPFSNFTNLELLNLEKNQLYHLNPQLLMGLENLTTLSLRNNLLNRTEVDRIQKDLPALVIKW